MKNWSKTFSGFILGALFLTLLIMPINLLYGFIRFKDSPIRPCAKYGYCGKSGQAHTKTEFEDYLRWEKGSLFICGVFSIGMLIMVLYAKKNKSA